MWTLAFWKAALERAIKSAAQGVIYFWGVGDGIFDLWTINAQETAGVAAGMGALSLLTTLATGVITSGQASLSKSELVAPTPPTPPPAA